MDYEQVCVTTLQGGCKLKYVHVSRDKKDHELELEFTSVCGPVWDRCPHEGSNLWVCEYFFGSYEENSF